MTSGNERQTYHGENSRSLEYRYIPEGIFGQTQGFVDLLEGYNSKLPKDRQRPLKDYAFLRHFLPAFVDDRNHRALEVNSEEYRDVVKLANRQFPMTTLAVMCMDGRVKQIHVFGFSASVGSSLRVPGGLLKEFVRGKDGGLKLDPDSHFAELLDGALNKNGDALAEVFDSHWGCAARKGEEAARGGNPEDSGLFSDVLHKKEMVKAAKKYLLDTNKEKQVVFMQTTFNPITGFLYTGLETDNAMEFARKFAQEKAIAEGKNPDNAVPVYSKDVIASLIEEGLIISTGHLANNPVVREKLDEHFFPVSWKNAYVDTARQFWTGIDSMKEALLPIFKRSIISIYPELSLHDKKTEKELEERAILLICNTYNAYLHNSDHVELEYLSMGDEEYETQGHYEYDTHNEQGIKVSEGGYPPYDIPMFVIFSGDVENMPANIELASGIVRENRAKGRISDSSGSYSDAEEFTKAPVPVVMQEIIRDNRLTEEDWKALENIDWSDLKDLEWDKMTPKEFAKYLERKGKLSSSLANGIERLRNTMAAIFDPNAVTSAHLIDQYKVALPVVCDGDRKTHAVIPFVKLGY